MSEANWGQALVGILARVNPGLVNAGFSWFKKARKRSFGAILGNPGLIPV